MFMRNEKYILFLALVSLQLSSSCTDSDSVFNDDLNQTDSSEKDEVDQQLKPFSKDRSVDKILEDFDRPLDSYPRITKDESFKDNQGIVYREGIDEPFTGRLIEYYEKLKKIVNWGIFNSSQLQGGLSRIFSLHTISRKIIGTYS